MMQYFWGYSASIHEGGKTYDTWAWNKPIIVSCIVMIEMIPFDEYGSQKRTFASMRIISGDNKDYQKCEKGGFQAI